MLTITTDLAEEENPVTAGFELRQKNLENPQFGTAINEFLVSLEGCEAFRFDLLGNQVWMLQTSWDAG